MPRVRTMEYIPPPPPQPIKSATTFKTLSGVVERITFANEETGYTIARLLPDPLPRSQDAHGPNSQAPEKTHVGNDQLVTIVGTLLGIVPGEALELTGFWKRHIEYGWQFIAYSYRSVLPSTAQGLRKYLGSGLIKGIGPRTAEKIVAYFALETLDILENHQERLLEVPGLGRRRAARITTAWEEQKAIQEVMLCLSELGVSTSLAVRIYKEYGDAAITIVKNEPYRLAREVWGIGFKTADKIALAQGYTPDHPERIKAGVLFALSEASGSEGHTYLPRQELAQKAAELLSATVEQAEEAITGLMGESGVQIEVRVILPDGAEKLEALQNHGGLVTDPFNYEVPVTDHPGAHVQGPQPAATASTLTKSSDGMSRLAMLPGEQMVYLPPFYAAEQGIAHHLLRLATCPPERGRLARLQQTNFGVMFEYLTSKAELILVERQQEGIVMALTHPVSILTGGPGTGKTTSLRALIQVLTLKKKKIILAAPTGRAAKRLSDATGLAAQTLHRLLQLKPGIKSPYDHANPLPADVVIIDEVSMLDTLLMNTLLKAIATGTHLLLVGDANQLASVGAGKVLADLIESRVVPIVRLEHIFRQKAGSSIALNAQRINQGLLTLTGPEQSECYFFTEDDPGAATNLIIDLVSRRIPTKFGFRPEEIQVLSPMHRGKCGVAELNARLQAVLNPHSPHKEERQYGGAYFRVGDKVLQLRNNYEKEVFNGDGGVITNISSEEQTMTVRLDDDRTVTYENGELDELALAYAISIHKAQGSEYPVCVIPLAMEQYLLLERQLVYTGVTRARQLVVLVGSKKALAIAVKNGPQRKGTGTNNDTETMPGGFGTATQPPHRSRRYTGLAIRLSQLASQQRRNTDVEGLERSERQWE